MSVLAFVRVLNAVKSVLSPSSEQRSSKRSKRQNNVRNVSQRVLFTAFSTSTSTLIRWYILGMEWDEKSHQKTQQWIAKSQCFNFKTPSFIWKRKHFVAFSCPVHIKPMKTQTFENALQSGKIWKCNSIGFVWTGRIHWKRKLLKMLFTVERFENATVSASGRVENATQSM